jgi:hypothetical protein
VTDQETGCPASTSEWQTGSRICLEHLQASAEAVGLEMGHGLFCLCLQIYSTEFFDTLYNFRSDALAKKKNQPL